MENKIYLFDTTLRDGCQTTGVNFTVSDKMIISKALDNLGIDYIEGGWPGANPTDDEFFKTRPTSVPSPNREHAHMHQPEVHPLKHEAANFIQDHVCKLNNKTLEFVETWKQTLTATDDILLFDLDWFNKEQVGWSDDRWRP